MRRTAIVVLAAVLAGTVVPAAGAAAAPRSFSGQCELSGAIAPTPGITILPRPGAHFSFHGSGQCRPARGRVHPATLDFDDVATLFDTCELGPDLGPEGVLRIAHGPHRPVRFPVTLDLARLAVAGPFELHARGGGLAVGVSQFAPDDPKGAISQCGGAGGGLVQAHLTATFRTLLPLVAR